MFELTLGLSCLIIGFILGALVITHPVAALRAVTPPDNVVAALKKDIEDLKAKVSGNVG